MTAARPWLKFYPRDWRADEKLRNCSLAARGLWMEMLAIMHGSERYGHLLINGNAPTDDQIAVQAGASSPQVTDLIAELDAAGVFSRTASRSIYSRRMTKDEKKAKTARKNGQSGGNPNLLKQKGKSPLVKGEDKAQDKDTLKLRGQRPESSDTNVSGETPAEDPVKAVFDLGVSILTKAGLSDREARSLVGRWRKLHGDPATSEALLSAREKSDPVAWIQGRFANIGRNSEELIASIERKYA